MRLKQLLTIVLLSTALYSCSKKDNNNSIASPAAPAKTSADYLTVNNINTSAVPAGASYSYIYAQLYANGVLLATTQDLYLPNTTFPANVPFNFPNNFNYSVNAFDLKIMTRGLATDYVVGEAHFELKNYSSARYPTPAELFFNNNGAAGTLHLSYQ